MRVALQQLRIGAVIRAKCQNMPGRRIFRRLFDDVECLNVAIDDRDAALDQAGKNLGLGQSNGLDIDEMFEMDRRDIGDDRHMWAHHADQRRDFAGVTHADLEHGVTRLLRQARQHQRHAPMIIIGFIRSMGRPGVGQHLAQSLFGRGFADRSGHGDNTRATAIARRDSEAFHRFEHVAHDIKRAQSAQTIGMVFIDDGGCGAALKSLGDIVMAIAIVALDGEKQIAWLQGAGVNGNPIDTFRHGAGNARLQGRDEAKTAPQEFS